MISFFTGLVSILLRVKATSECPQKKKKKKRDSLTEGEPPHLLNKYPVIPSGLTFHCIVELLLMEVQPSDHY